MEEISNDKADGKIKYWAMLPRISLAALSLVVVFVVYSLLTLYWSQQLSLRETQIVQLAQNIAIGEDISNQLAKIYEQEQLRVLAPTEENRLQHIVKLRAMRGELADMIGAYRGLGEESSVSMPIEESIARKASLEKIGTLHEAYEENSQKVGRLLENGDSADAVASVYGEGKKSLDNLRVALKEDKSQIQAAINGIHNSSGNIYGKGRLVTIVLAVLVIALVGAGVYYFRLYIRRAVSSVLDIVVPELNITHDEATLLGDFEAISLAVKDRLTSERDKVRDLMEEIAQLAASHNAEIVSEKEQLAPSSGDQDNRAALQSELNNKLSHVRQQAAAAKNSLTARQTELNALAETLARVTAEAADSGMAAQRTRDALDYAISKITAKEQDRVKLEEQAENIGELAANISAVAGQTKLLAFGAALEAARSGSEEGRRFAATTDEVNKLSAEVQQLAEKIAAINKDLLTAVKDYGAAFDDRGYFLQNRAGAAGASENFDSIAKTLADIKNSIVASGDKIDTAVKLLETAELSETADDDDDVFSV